MCWRGTSLWMRLATSIVLPLSMDEWTRRLRGGCVRRWGLEVNNSVARSEGVMSDLSVPRLELRGGYEISRIIKGGWQLAGDHGPVDPAKAPDEMAEFVRAGITTFDCADIYTGVEAMIGEFRGRHPDLAKGVRVHTKFVPDL